MLGSALYNGPKHFPRHQLSPQWATIRWFELSSNG